MISGALLSPIFVWGLCLGGWGGDADGLCGDGAEGEADGEGFECFGVGVGADIAAGADEEGEGGADEGVSEVDAGDLVGGGGGAAGDCGVAVHTLGGAPSGGVIIEGAGEVKAGAFGGKKLVNGVTECGGFDVTSDPTGGFVGELGGG